VLPRFAIAHCHVGLPLSMARALSANGLQRGSRGSKTCRTVSEFYIFKILLTFFLAQRSERGTLSSEEGPRLVHVPGGGQSIARRRGSVRRFVKHHRTLLQRSGAVRRNLHEEVSARIIKELEAGAAPWNRPWSSTAGQNVPQNAVTNRPYSGCNVILLWLARDRGWPTPRFLTLKQAIDAGGNVRKGQHGTKVYFVKQLRICEGDAGDEIDEKIVPMLREYTVFNVAQCENLADSIIKGKPVRVRNPDARDELADQFLRSTAADIREGQGEAYYAPGADFISLPCFEAFKGADHFYNVAFHELTHWTGHKSRLDRDLRHRFGERAYAAEELVAELGAAFLAAEFSFDGDVRNAGYIAGWIELLKADKRAFFTACNRAQAAAESPREEGPPSGHP
jgi:antirestriction protein ArdC